MYRFETIEEDLFKLVYIKNGETKEIPFKRNIDIASRMDGVNSNANKKLMLELTKEGLTASDFTIKRTTEDGKIIYDNTNWIEFKKAKIEEETGLVLIDILEHSFKMKAEDLFEELGLDMNNEQELQDFLLDYFKIMKEEKNAFPSGIAEHYTKKSEETDKNNI